MKAIRVQYTIKSEFVEQNKQNIAAVMAELRTTDNTDVKYSSYQHEDGKTFMHLVVYNSPNAENLPSSLPAFEKFQAELKQNLEIPPKVETFNLTDSSFDLF